MMARSWQGRHDPTKYRGHGREPIRSGKTPALRPRTLLSAIVAALVAQPAVACVGVPGPGLVRLTVLATGVRDARGEIAVTVYPDVKRRFLAKGGKLSRARVPAVAGTTEACFWLAPGSYPVAVYHDANGDRDFNRTLFYPKEGFGFSNDAPTTFGLPAFDKVRAPVGPGATTLRIRMRYP